jgi:hypothetical protein
MRNFANLIETFLRYVRGHSPGSKLARQETWFDDVKEERLILVLPAIGQLSIVLNSNREGYQYFFKVNWIGETGNSTIVMQTGPLSCWTITYVKASEWYQEESQQQLPTLQLMIANFEWVVGFQESATFVESLRKSYQKRINFI